MRLLTVLALLLTVSACAPQCDVELSEISSLTTRGWYSPTAPEACGYQLPMAVPSDGMEIPIYAPTDANCAVTTTVECATRTVDVVCPDISWSGTVTMTAENSADVVISLSTPDGCTDTREFMLGGRP